MITMGINLSYNIDKYILTFAIIERGISGNYSINYIDKIVVRKIHFPDYLVFIKSELVKVILDYNCDHLIYKEIEKSAFRRALKDHEMHYFSLEGVIMELVLSSNSNIKKIVDRKQMINCLQIESKEKYKSLLEGGNDSVLLPNKLLSDVKDWYEREAVLSALTSFVD